MSVATPAARAAGTTGNLGIAPVAAISAGGRRLRRIGLTGGVPAAAVAAHAAIGAVAALAALSAQSAVLVGGGCAATLPANAAVLDGAARGAFRPVAPGEGVGGGIVGGGHILAGCARVCGVEDQGVGAVRSGHTGAALSAGAAAAEQQGATTVASSSGHAAVEAECGGAAHSAVAAVAEQQPAVVAALPRRGTVSTVTDQRAPQQGRALLVDHVQQFLQRGCVGGFGAGIGGRRTAQRSPELLVKCVGL